MSLPLAFRKVPPPIWVGTNLGNQSVNAALAFRQDAGHAHSLMRANNIASSFRFECGPGDFAPGETDRMRSELQFTDKLPFDTDLWMAWSVRVTAPEILWNSCVLGQLHQTEDVGDASGYPPFEVNLHADGLYVFTATNPIASAPSFYPRTQRAGPIPFALGVIHDVIVKIRVNWLGSATLNVWLDGESICSVTGASIGMNDLVGPYLKLGVYYRVDDPADYYAQEVVAEYWHIAPAGEVDLSSRVANPPIATAGDDVDFLMLTDPATGRFITDPRPGRDGVFVTLP